VRAFLLAMSRPIVLAIHIMATGKREAQRDISEVGTAFDVVVNKARNMNRAMKDSKDAVKSVGNEAQNTGREFEKTESKAHKLGRAIWSATKAGIEGFTGLDLSIKGVARSAHSLLDRIDQIKKKTAFGLFGASVAETALLGKGVMNAGQMQLIKAGLETNLKGSGVSVEDMLAQLKKFDADSQLDFAESAKTANYMISQGFDPRTVVDKMRVLGDAVGATGGTQEDFQGIARALAQIQAKGKFSMEEANQLGDRGVNAAKYVSEATGISRADIISGKANIAADVAVKAIIEGMQRQFAGGMEKAAGTLPGQLSTLQGALFQLGATIGQHLLPPVMLSIQVLTGFINMINNLPEPIQKVLSYGMALNAVFLGLAAGLLLIAGPLSSAIFAWKILKFILPGVNLVLGIFGTSVGQVATQIITKMIPSLFGLSGATGVFLATAGTALGLLGAALAGFYIAFQGTQAALTQSAAQLQYHFGYLGSFWVKAGDMLTALWNHPLFRWVSRALNPVGTIIGDALGLRTDDPNAGDNSDEYNESVDDVRRREQAAATPAALFPPTPVTPTPAVASPSAIPGMAPFALGSTEARLLSDQPANVQAAQAAVDRLTREIQALQDQKRHADKDQKPILQDQIVAKQRQLQAARRELAATKKLASMAEKDANQVERDAAMLAQIEIENRYEDQIRPLRAALKKAKSDGNTAEVQRLTTQIAALKAQEKRDKAIAKAKGVDGAHGDALRRAAQLSFGGDMADATLAGDLAGIDGEGGSRKKALSPAEVAALFRASGGTYGGGIPYSAPGASFIANSGAYYAANGLGPGGNTPSFVSGVPSLANFGGKQGKGQSTARKIGENTWEMPDGSKKTVIQFEISQPYQGIGDLPSP
jgi:tape measure domain-containing protein